MLGVTLTLETEAARFMRELCRHRSPDEPRKANVVLKDQYGDIASVRGGMFNANGGRDVRLSLAGLTRSDVTAFRQTVKERLGFEPPVPMAEALLIQTQSEVPVSESKEEKRRAYEREKKARRRQWARAKGYCIICCKNAAGYRESDGAQLATCRDCQAKANAAKKRA